MGVGSGVFQRKPCCLPFHILERDPKMSSSSLFFFLHRDPTPNSAISRQVAYSTTLCQWIGRIQLGGVTSHYLVPWGTRATIYVELSACAAHGS
jgi:hypothetical protein